MSFFSKIKSLFSRGEAVSWRTAVAAVRREYTGSPLTEDTAGNDPLPLFEQWYSEAAEKSMFDANAFVLGTCAQGKPKTRVVLLKGFDEKGFVFYTSYESDKGSEMGENPSVSMLFFWPEVFRQLRIEGTAEKVSEEESDVYFNSRPRISRISAIVSPQSRVIESRAKLEEKQTQLNKSSVELSRPESWGGYRVVPNRYEFWQGRTGRLHDRILFELDAEKSWKRSRLAP